MKWCRGWKDDDHTMWCKAQCSGGGGGGGTIQTLMNLFWLTHHYSRQEAAGTPQSSTHWYAIGAPWEYRIHSNLVKVLREREGTQIRSSTSRKGPSSGNIPEKSRRLQWGLSGETELLFLSLPSSSELVWRGVLPAYVLRRRSDGCSGGCSLSSCGVAGLK